MQTLTLHKQAKSWDHKDDLATIIARNPTCLFRPSKTAHWGDPCSGEFGAIIIDVTTTVIDDGSTIYCGTVLSADEQGWHYSADVGNPDPVIDMNTELAMVQIEKWIIDRNVIKQTGN